MCKSALRSLEKLKKGEKIVDQRRKVSQDVATKEAISNYTQDSKEAEEDLSLRNEPFGNGKAITIMLFKSSRRHKNE